MGGKGSGGRRARPGGPPPDPGSVRQAKLADRGGLLARNGWTTLPAAGRQAPAPDWPLPTSNAREREVWAELWRKPQALVWEQFGQQHIVGLYVRRLVESEARSAPVSLSTLVRQLADTLGLTTPGLVSNRWRIEQAPAEQTSGPTSSATGSRARLRVVDEDGAE